MLEPQESLNQIPTKINKVDCLHKATVVGPENTPIYTDEHGRIKVQFDWDENGTNDENSFDWVRVKQQIASSGFGMQMLPRVGMDVIVAFENGDINQPVVLGCLPSEANPLPFNPAEHRTQSGFQSRSLSEEEKFPSRGGMAASADGVVANVKGHYLKFEDDADNPSVSLHSHKDMHIKAAGNVTNKIGGSSTTTIEEGNYVQLVGDTLKINAKTAVHFVCGQSRLSITNTDIIVEADEIAFDSEPMAVEQSASAVVPRAAVVAPPTVTEHKTAEEKKEEVDEEEFKLFVATVYGEALTSYQSFACTCSKLLRSII
jgi:type VI secretion system secreted protein VgrG